MFYGLHKNKRSSNSYNVQADEKSVDFQCRVCLLSVAAINK